MVISLGVLVVVFHSPVRGPVDHQAECEYRGRHCPGVNSGRMRFVDMRLRCRGTLVAAGRRPVKDALADIGILLEYVENAIALIVELAPEPVRPGGIRVGGAIDELLPVRWPDGNIAFPGGVLLRARGIGTSPAIPVGIKVQPLGFELTMKVRHGRPGPGRVTRTATRRCHRVPPIRYRPIIRPNGAGACLPSDFLPTPRLGQLPILVLPPARRSLRR